MILVVQDVGCSRLHAVFLGEHITHTTPQLPEFSTVTELAPVEEGLLAQVASDVSSPRWIHLCLETGKTTPTPLSSRPFVAFEGAKVKRTWAPSKDGTLVPVTVIFPRTYTPGTPHPCVVTGYGGFGICLEPRFHPERKVLVERGFIVAIAHIRGGGEMGSTWHREGRMHLKQNVFDDFAGVLDHLVEGGFTTPDRLGIFGASNGGILMGAMINQFPDKMAAVLSTVGVYDMLRFEAHPNGELLTGEYGTIQDESDFHVLHSYSPVHNVREGGPFPKILLATGAEDSRVNPMQTAKYGAALQAAGADVSVRIVPNQGHLVHSPSEQVDEWAEHLTFFIRHLERERTR